MMVNILDTLGIIFYTTLMSDNLLVIHYHQNTYNTLLLKSSIQSHYICNITGNENLYENYVITPYCNMTYFRKHRYVVLFGVWKVSINSHPFTSIIAFLWTCLMLEAIFKRWMT